MGCDALGITMRIFSKEHRRKLSEANRKKWSNPDYKKKVSKSIKDSYTSSLRKKRSESTTNQMKVTHQRIIRSKSYKGNYDSVKEKKIGHPRVLPIREMTCKQCSEKFSWSMSDRSGLFCSRSCYLKFVKENSSSYRIKAFALLPNECFYCLEKDKSKLQVHHKNRDFLDNDIENLVIVCNKCHSKQHRGEAQKSRFSKFKDGQILRGVRLVLDGLRVSLKDQHFIGTPERVLRSYYELLEGRDSEKEMASIFSESFPSTYEGMVILDPVKCFSICPHHLLPIEYDVNIGYISKKGSGKTLGLSKLARVVKLLAKDFIIQENFTQGIIETFKDHLKVSGVMVIVYGKHMCMRMRGIEQPDSTTITSSVFGIFDKDTEARQEFLALVKGRLI